MDNHVHLLLETNPKSQLSKFMQRLNLGYSCYYQKKYGNVGHLWQGRFKSLLVEKESYLLACGLYVERNPVRAGMVGDAQDYLYSSYAHYAGRRRDPLVEYTPLYCDFGKDDRARQKEYRRLTATDEKCIGEKTFKKLFLGGSNFVREMEEKFGVKNPGNSAGRPWK